MSLNILIPILILVLLVGIGFLLVKLFKWLRKDKDKLEKSKIDTDDGWNRTFYGTPTIGGIIVVAAIILYIIFNSNF